MRLTSILSLACGAHALSGRPGGLLRPDGRRRELLQDVVTYDNDSLLVGGERLMVFSGEFHPFRLPVPSLWLDVFQKIKALGLNTVSFYLHWGSLEGKSGDFNAEGALAIEPFLQAAQEAGLYLIARPGPYISKSWLVMEKKGIVRRLDRIIADQSRTSLDAEATGGGFPGWLQRIEGKLRTNATDFLHATDKFVPRLPS